MWTSVCSCSSCASRWDYCSQSHSTVLLLQLTVLRGSSHELCITYFKSFCLDSFSYPESLYLKSATAVQPALPRSPQWCSHPRKAQLRSWCARTQFSSQHSNSKASLKHNSSLALIWFLFMFIKSSVQFSDCISWRWFCSWGWKHLQDHYIFWKMKLSYAIFLYFLPEEKHYSGHIQYLWQF